MPDISTKKILICTGIFPPDIGGPATYSESLALAFHERGYQIAVVTYADHAGSVQTYPFPVVRVKRSGFKVRHYYRYYSAVKKIGKNFDVLYAQDPVSAGYPTYLANKSLRKKLVLKITGDYSWEQAMGRRLTDKLIDDFQKISNYPRPIRNIRAVQLRVCQHADQIVTPAEYLKRLVAGWGISENKIRVIYNSAPDIPQLSRDQARQELGLAPRDFRIFSAGRLVPWKGFDVLQTAVVELAKSHPEISLEILNSVARSELLERLAAADVLVLNTAYEGSPHLIFEAMALGVPVVTTAVCGNPEFVKHEATGLLIEYGSKQQIQAAILRLMTDRSLGARLAANARQSLRRFTFETMVSQTAQLLNSLVQI